MSNETLVLFTASYPYGEGEEFIGPELHIAQSFFNKVILVPYKTFGEKRTPLPGIEIESYNKNISNQGSVGFSTIFRILFIEFIHTKSKWFFLKNIRKWSSYVKKATIDSFWIENLLDKKKEVICYSFWMNDWALALAILKLRQPDLFFATRALGFDIWNERHEGNYLPFRYFIYSKANGIFPNSIIAENYLKELKVFPEKIRYSYLGTLQPGKLPEPVSSGVIKILSVSAIIPLKRVMLIARALKKISFDIQWTHIGEGEEEGKLREEVKNMPANVEVILPGRVDNLHYFLQSNYFHFFISLSSSEGLPVTIQEVTSFGMPVLATDVGGTSEIVNRKCGILLNADPSPDHVAEEIFKMKNKIVKGEFKREDIQEYWRQNFSSSSVYPPFYTALKKMKQSR